MTPRRSAPPLWFQLCVAVALAFLCRAVFTPADATLPAGGHALDVQYGFWFFITAIASAIWKGLEVAGKVTLAALEWSVKALWWFATTTANGLKFVGQQLLTGLKKTWQFFRDTYDRVLKPAFKKIAAWYHSFRKWWEDTFGPVLRFLRTIRDHLMEFYKTFIRPWLDLIEVTRRLLRIASSLGFKWARALDARLGQISDAIDRPFRLVLGKLNEVINIVNRVVTADGLFQRIALVRSLGRDYRYAWRAVTQPYSSPVTQADRDKATTALGVKELPQIVTETRAYMRDRSGPRAALLDEMAITWRNYLTGRS